MYKKELSKIYFSLINLEKEKRNQKANKYFLD
jgi:hypothetical protein